VPGYKALPIQFSGDAAQHVRYAEVLQRAGDPSEAVLMLEWSLDVYERTSRELPGWLCGRLATLYRSLRRYDDEVLMLERYRESQSSEDARSRFDARLSKARAIADRKRRTDTRALSSVRRVINGREDGDLPATIIRPLADGAFSSDTLRGVATALAAAASVDGPLDVAPASLVHLCDEARRRGHPPERIVVALKDAWHATPRPAHLGAEAWEALYRIALTRALALYFSDGVP
jgi:hypothetical protein